MKPDAPPSSHEVITAVRNAGNGMPADSIAHGTVMTSATARQPPASPGYSSFSKSGPVSVRMRADSAMRPARLRPGSGSSPGSR